jgi:poly(beta-D-mannuronate) lyase
LKGRKKKSVASHLLSCGLVLCIAFALRISQASEPLRSPFDVSQRRELLGARIEAWSCPAPPAAVRDLTFSGFYADADQGSSIIDPAAKKAYDNATRAVTQYESRLTEMSDVYVRSNPPNGAAAACVLDWLHAWAREEAMLGRATEQGGYVRKWGLAPASASYLKIRMEPSLDPAMRSGVERWISRWASIVKNDYSTGMQRSSRQNNHLYWAACSVMLAGIVLNDTDLYEWALDRYRFAMKQIQSDGTLPLELARKSKALHYHNFAVAALVLIAETLAKNGSDPFALGDGALPRLAKRTVAGLEDPSYFEQHAHAKQDLARDLNGFDLAWMEPYYARFRDSPLEKWIRRLRPMKNRWLGGDMTLLFGVPKLSSG